MKKRKLIALILTLSLVLVSSIGMASAAGTLLADGGGKVTINDKDFSTDAWLYFDNSADCVYIVSECAGSTYRMYTMNSIKYSTSSGYITDNYGATGTQSRVTGTHTSSKRYCSTGSASSVTNYSTITTFAYDSAQTGAIVLSNSN